MLKRLRFGAFLAVFALVACGDREGDQGNQPPGEAPQGMVWIPGGEFEMGANHSEALMNEKPVHAVRVKAFWMDETEVTNAEFREFVEATGYVTGAEKAIDPADYPDANPEDLKAGSLVFTMTDGPVPLDNHMRWWRFQPGANWRQPTGPGSSIEGRDDHPVVCITWEDAAAYAKWAGKRLPTEAEWELAARGGLENAKYVWGDSMSEDQPMANLWQGDFPYDNAEKDGFGATAPVKSFPPNGYGLYDMSGNVWEFVQDWYDPDYYIRSPEFNPPGPTLDLIMDPSARLRPHSDDRPQLATIPHKVIRGGSYLCNDCYCRGYRPSARQITDTITSINHTGFRCVKSAE